MTDYVFLVQREDPDRGFLVGDVLIVEPGARELILRRRQFANWGRLLNELELGTIVALTPIRPPDDLAILAALPSGPLPAPSPPPPAASPAHSPRESRPHLVRLK